MEGLNYTFQDNFHNCHHSFTALLCNLRQHELNNRVLERGIVDNGDIPPRKLCEVNKDIRLIEFLMANRNHMHGANYVFELTRLIYYI